ncbi:hypothetical protein NJC38_02565 [Pseudomonas sp. 21LCFQ010]|uniref:hypothetical protein n=1 Tax=Pseudomonas sp. 21LCFQ010 TaxID=2957506 RepID=UPI002097773F|nr:hypothetical protein [Pseudomonas sp. 21LCFQ010]MCO8161033.1 hypothetical protein [Pseudomonas sp. 21LCFQ010]
MGMTQQERDAKRRAKEARMGAEELRIKVMAGEKQMAREIMEWLDDTEQASVILTSVRYMHSLGPEGVREAVKNLRARHKFVISENVAADFHAKSLLMIQQDQGDEIEAPLLK